MWKIITCFPNISMLSWEARVIPEIWNYWVPDQTCCSVLHTLGVIWQLCAQVSMAGRFKKRLWPRMAAVAVGSCIHVHRQLRYNWHLYVLIQRDRQRNCSPQRPQHEHSRTFWTHSYFFELFFFSSLLPVHPSCLFISISSVLSGESVVPYGPVCASAEMTSILSGGGFIVLLLTLSTTRASLHGPLCLRILKSGS